MSAELEPLREDWTRLAEASRRIFSTWEWASTWWRHFGRGRRLLLSRVLSPGGSPLAILPLYEWRERPVRILRFVGHGPADELGPISGPAGRGEAAGALRRVLDGGGGDVLLAEQLRRDEGWDRILGDRVVRREASPTLRLAGTWEGFLASKSRNLREQVGLRERRLARSGRLRYRLTEDPAKLGRDLDTLFGLHRARWRGVPSAFAAEAFHREFAATALERGWLRLWLLELEGRAVAAWYGFRFAGVESYYQAGRDPAWDRASVGFVLLAHTIREAFADGMAEYRFLRGDEPFKYRFADEDQGLVTVLAAGSALGRALVAGAEAAARVPPLRSAAGRLLR
jgi:CelD/BcsL family acetyltransferase involved in cellulose biosynthesis